MANEKIILAYSGGLDTSVAIKWLNEQYGYDVVAVAVDVGEGKDLNIIKEKALQVGAVSSHVIDAKDQFAENYLKTALQSNALYEGVYPLISALSRPLIAQLLVNIAKQENAVAIAHGCTGKGNDQVRFDIAINALAPHLKIVAPARENPISREEAIQYAQKHNIPLPIKLESPYSIDQNIWGRSCECGVLEDPWVQPPEDAYELTSSIDDAPDKPCEIEIEFSNGQAVKLDGKSASFVNIIHTLNEVAGQNGIGRIDHIENRLIGIKSREVYEAPAAMTLIKAHQALEAITLTRDVAHFKPIIEQYMAKLIYEGQWFSPAFSACKAFIENTQQYVNGHVRVKLHKGHATVVGRKSANSLYNFELATYNPDDQFDHNAAIGFIKLFGLPLEVHAKVNEL